MDGTLSHQQQSERSRVLRIFVDGSGYVPRLPAKDAKRRVVLDYVAQAFEIGRHYSEPEVDATLVRFHDDYPALRRYLVEAGFLDRENNVYWRAGGTVDA